MGQNLNMNNKNINHLRPPTNNTDAATKKYVDGHDSIPDTSSFIKKDGTIAMTGDLNVGNNKIVGLATIKIKNLSNLTQDNEAVTKDYVDKLVHHTAVQPSHYKDEFSYLISS